VKIDLPEKGFQHPKFNSLTKRLKMKKLAITLIACLACFQSTQATASLLAQQDWLRTQPTATSALVESLLEYQAIISFIGNPMITEPEQPIPATEAIVDINRITQQVDITGLVEYEIVTRGLTVGTDQLTAEVGDIEARHSHWSSHRRGRHHHHHHCPHQHCHNNNNNQITTTYLATLSVQPNTGIGPNTVTVLSIVPSQPTLNPLLEEIEISD
jgi:ABC-type nickel/cobalt efflux system permease component RcnA